MSATAQTEAGAGGGRFAAVVLGADRPGRDPVAGAAGVASRCLVPVHGVPMVLRVLDALAQSEAVEGPIWLCGPVWAAVASSTVLRERIDAGAVRWLAPAESASASAAAALQRVPEGLPVLLVSADHPLLTPAMVDLFAARARETRADVAVALTLHAPVMALRPGRRRSAIALRDAHYCGCNLFALLSAPGRGATAFWARVEAGRKRPWRLVAALGWGALLRYALGRLELADGLARLSRAMGLRVEAVLMPWPEAALDVDRPEDLPVAERLAGVRAAAGAGVGDATLRAAGGESGKPR